MSSDHFSSHAAAYEKARPSYPSALFDWLTVQSKSHDLVWDCGTGNGQAAVALARHFGQVHATDLSAQQIAIAQPHPKIHYVATPAEASGLPNASVDLITVAQALHWFDHPRFYAEVRRVLKPGGMLAAWTYTLLRGAPQLNALIKYFHGHVVGPWWPPERKWVDLGYRGLPFPFVDIAAPTFEIRLEWRPADLLAYLRTWSATQRYMKEKGTDPTLMLAHELAACWPADELRIITWPIAIRAGFAD